MAKTKKTWIVTTSGKRSLTDVTKDLKKRGFKVGEVMKEIGIITGEAGDEAVQEARQIDGVSDVSAESVADVGPPNSRNTW